MATDKVVLGDCTLYLGDCLEVMKDIPDKSVNCAITSPPYYGLRDYGVEGQIGLEETPEEYVQKLVSVFREVKRVLRDDGTLWLNLGDSYNGSGKAGNNPEYQNKHTEFGKPSIHVSRFGMPTKIDGLKPKDLIGIPWMVAFALRTDGWYLRQDIIWAKPNPMPESVKDRCTKSHEYIFLLSKNGSYYFDNQIISEKAIEGFDLGLLRSKKGINGKDPQSIIGNRKDENSRNAGNGLRNKRSVWTVTTKPFKEVHFATFPEDLIRPCVLAGCPDGGTILDPFNGAGTTGVVSVKNGRKYIGIELNPEYIEMSLTRIKKAQQQMRLPI